MKEINVIGNPKSLLNFNVIGGHGVVNIAEKNKESNLPWTTEKINNVIEDSYKLNDEDNFKYLRNFVFTYLRVNNITLEQLKQNINNKTSDLTKSQREFVINNL